MTDTDAIDVLVVGAGPTGLALAAELAAFGVRFRIVDRRPDRVHESRALAIQPRTLEVLARHGLAGRLVQAGNPAVHLQLHTPSRVVSLRLFDIGIADTAYPFLLFLSQAETERILGEHLHHHGVAVERRVELVDLSPGNDVVACQLRHPDGTKEIARARYVVGCDGAHSTVRSQAGIGFTGYPYPQTFLLADLEADALDPDAVHTWFTDTGVLFFFPLGSPATFRMLAMRPPDDPDTPVTLELLQAITDRATGGGVRLRDPAWLTDFRLHNSGATHYQMGRMFLAGDAAHIHSPAGAQGMNTGIQDAVNLGWKLALVCHSRAHPALLDTYEPERSPVGRAVLRMSDRAFTIATTRNPLIRFARTHLVPRIAPLALRTRLRGIAFRTVAQLAIGYRHSPLNADGTTPPRRGPRAGDRLPDASIIRNGQVSTLHAATATPTYHLLLCGPATAWSPNATEQLNSTWPGLITTLRLSREPADGVLYDRDGTALRRLGADPDSPVHYLVRPDGYIAYRDRGTDLTGVRASLAYWLNTTIP